MGLDISFGEVCKPIIDKNVFSTLEEPQFDIFAPLAVKVTRQMTCLKAIADKRKLEFNYPDYWCNSSELRMNKQGLYYHSGIAGRGVKFENLVESEETFYKFSMQVTHYCSHWFAATNLKPSFDFPFIFQRERALELIPSLKEDYEYLLDFLQNFETGKHLIYLSY